MIGVDGGVVLVLWILIVVWLLIALEGVRRRK